MNAVGIICEYNPFHAGHALQIAKTLEILGENTPILCVMSGSVTQRGEPAIEDKWKRAADAVRTGGANLVLELPAPLSCASAEPFAAAGVYALCATGVCSHISFGAECGDLAQIYALADSMEDDITQNRMREYLSLGYDWGESMRRAIRSDAAKRPNNLLGACYIRALRRLGSPLSPIAVPRDGALPSSSVLRRNMRGISVFNHERVMLSRLRSLTAADWARITDVSEGLENRLYRAAHESVTLHGFFDAAKSRRYAAGRLRRIALRAYLGIPDDLCGARQPYLRVLAFDRAGAMLLREMKRSALLPVLTKPAAYKKLDADAKRFFELECRITDTLAFNAPAIWPSGREFTSSPEKIDK